jgi:Putative N-acetylmannosamine-6-phosphate epimerase
MNQIMNWWRGLQKIQIFRLSEKARFIIRIRL